MSRSKMAVDRSEMSCSIKMHLSDNETKSREHSDHGKDPAKQLPGSSRVEKLCKTVAFLIVLWSIRINLARVLREGKLIACLISKYSSEFVKKICRRFVRKSSVY